MSETESTEGEAQDDERRSWSFEELDGEQVFVSYKCLSTSEKRTLTGEFVNKDDENEAKIERESKKDVDIEGYQLKGVGGFILSAQTVEDRIEEWKENHLYEEEYRDSGCAPPEHFGVKLVADNGDTLIYWKTNTNPHGDEDIKLIEVEATGEEVTA